MPAKMQIKTKAESITPFFIFITAIFSFMAGFYTVYLLRPEEDSELSTSNKTELYTTRPVDINSSDASKAVTAKSLSTRIQEERELPREKNNSKDLYQNQNKDITIPPPRAIPSEFKVEKIIYWRCWKENDPQFLKDCDKLPVMEKRIKNRLYILKECMDHIIHEPEDRKGILSLGTKIYFKEQKITFWAGRSSTISSAKDVVKCLRDRLKTIKFDRVKHNFNSYTMFFSINISPDNLPMNKRGGKHK